MAQENVRPLGVMIPQRADMRTPERIRELLAQPFRPDQLQRRTVAGKTLTYIDAWAVRDRLDRACNTWSWTLQPGQWEMVRVWRGSGSSRAITEVPAYVVIGELLIPELGRRAGRGVQIVDDGAGVDLVTGADSQALKRAAFMFGLWRPGGSN